MPVVFYDALTPSERDYTAILTKLQAADPDLIFFTGYYSPKRVCCSPRRRKCIRTCHDGRRRPNNTDS